MSADFSTELRDDLLTDFYAESDEHLHAIREALVVLENSVGRAQVDSSIVEKLFRSFHSFKGISAIAGIRPAEELAHRTEDYLRDLSRGNTTLTVEGLDFLMNATQRLEQVVLAHREHQALPEITPLLHELSSILPRRISEAPDGSKPPESARETLSNRIERARARGALLWTCAFTPSAALDQRGINVSSVRKRLTQIGEIIQAIPKVQAGGGISFEFLAALREMPDLSGWEADGLQATPFEAAPPPSVPAGTQISPDSSTALSTPFVAPSHVVRVDLSRLDELMRLTGELVIHRARLEEQINRLGGSTAARELEGIQEVNLSLARALRDLREGIMRVRLVPVAEIFARMPFVARDLAHETGKKARVTLAGQQTEVDKYLVERLKDPLLHLVRNAISHGIENPARRAAAGKPADATISLKATTVGDCVLMEVADDGRGIDLEAVRTRARAMGKRIPEKFDTAALLEVLCTPGFSTRDEADRGAGRGVGMAAVNNAVRELGGSLMLETRLGEGTRFILRLPLTLAIADAFIVSSGGQTFAIPQTFVQEVIQITSENLRMVNRTELMPYRNGVLPLVRLANLFGITASRRVSCPVLVLSSEKGITGIVVDRVVEQREVVVRAMRDPLVKVPGVAGATELGDGKPVLILDASALANGVARPHENEHARHQSESSLAMAT